jgi:hypothetical protein
MKTEAETFVARADIGSPEKKQVPRLGRANPNRPNPGRFGFLGVSSLGMTII